MERVRARVVREGFDRRATLRASRAPDQPVVGAPDKILRIDFERRPSIELLLRVDQIPNHGRCAKSIIGGAN